ncbi:MAG: 2,3-bisphosphoglycerate-independent phosphoglycerate mutase [bacterium]
MAKAKAPIYKKVVLLILDGWGLGKSDASNAIFMAKTPTINGLYRKYPWVTLEASGLPVGLPLGQVGNSEAGHLNLGAGRIVDQDVVKISKQISTGEFFKNPAFLAAIKHVENNKSNIHLMGLLSTDQSPHSSPDHLMALLMVFRRVTTGNIYLHLFTDGRDSPPRSALKAVEALERFLTPKEKIATIIGRFYAMDRKKSWDRNNKAYEAMVLGVGHKGNSPQEGITRAYNANVTDEFIEPVIMYDGDKMLPRISDKDALVYFNLRSDRARQLTKLFVQKDFEGKNLGAPKRKKVLQDLLFVAMTDFGPDLDTIYTAYPSEDVRETLPLALKDKKQIYIAESEKYAHMTYFFNGGYADKIDGEDRVMVPSPMVDSYDLKPVMSTAQITTKILGALRKYDFIAANFACPDMVGHTGNFKAGIKEAEAVDKYVKKVLQAVLKAKGALIITADHGNLEYMLNLETGEIITEHTGNQVPFILVGRDFNHKTQLKTGGCLGNVAPTILKLMGVKKDPLMTKDSLL